MGMPPAHEAINKDVLSMNPSMHSFSKSSLNSSNNGNLNSLNSSPSISRVAATIKKQNTPSAVAAAPAGDDFFKTFGV